MFYYLNPGFKDNQGHHIVHQAIFNKLYQNEFGVISNKNNFVQNLPYQVIKCFKYNTWQYLRNKRNLKLFETEIANLKNITTAGDTIFMYMSDILFLVPILEAKIKHGVKGKFIINLFHTGRYLIDFEKIKSKVKDLLIHTESLRANCGVFLVVETEQLQTALSNLTGSKFPILPMFHSSTFPIQKIRNETNSKIIVSYLSASIPRGLKLYVDLINYIYKHDFQLTDKIEFRLRIFQRNPLSDQLVDGIKDKVKVQYGSVSDSEYQNLVTTTDIMLLPYLSKHFYANTSGVFSDSFMNEIPVIATQNTWLGTHTNNYQIGQTFDENNVKSFYNALIKVLENYQFYKKNVVQNKLKWEAYHSQQNLKYIFDSFQYNESTIHNTKEENKLLKSVRKIHLDLIDKLIIDDQTSSNRFTQFGMKVVDKIKFELKKLNNSEN